MNIGVSQKGFSSNVGINNSKASKKVFKTEDGDEVAMYKIKDSAISNFGFN